MVPASDPDHQPKRIEAPSDKLTVIPVERWILELPHDSSVYLARRNGPWPRRTPRGRSSTPED
jgi:hypothetical protein